MLGRFLEFSIAVPDIRASLDYYCRIGFSETPVGEAWAHPYAVLTDGRICLGLHEQADFISSLTFVRPDLLQHLDRLEQLGLEFQFRHLGNDVFNEVGWVDPSGHLIRLVEARTFSPSKRRAIDTGLCGYFQEIALPTPDPDTAKSYWERFGFVGIDETDALLPHVSCTSDTVDVGLYEAGHFPVPTLLFEADDFADAVTRLDAVGAPRDGRVPAPLRPGLAVRLTAPEGTPLLLCAAQER